MRITSLRLVNFRNHANLLVSFEKPICFIVGKNTSGKTNILESLNILTFGKSKKAEKENDLIQKGQTHSSIKATIENKVNFTLQVIYAFNNKSNQVQRKYLKNNLSKTQSNFAGNFLTVSFFPEDLKIVSDSPSFRRNFLNSCLIQVDEKYKKSLNIYEKAIRSRNVILEKIQSGFGKREELVYWTKIAIENGNYITKKRQEFIDFLNQETKIFSQKTKYFPRLSIHVIYDKSEITNERLEKYSSAEIASTQTLVGPHRDDLIFLDSDRNLKIFGSRGEQRMLLLFLKIKELEYIEKEKNEKPILLLDDIFSELDFKNRDLILSLIQNHQTIITTAEEKEISSLNLKNSQKIYL